MLTKLHCPCGHHQPVEPAKLKPQVRCKQCRQALSFRPSGASPEETFWLAVGGSSGPPRLAVPVPLGITLKIGRATDCWLVLPGDDIAEAQVEVTLQPDRRLTVRHLGGDSGTWINRARIISGVLRAEDTLRMGSYLLRLRTQTSLPKTDGADLPAVVVVEEELPAEAPGYTETGESLEGSDQFADGTGGGRARLVVCIVIVVAAAIYWVSSMAGSGLSPDMPLETAYHCPVDGTVWRASWSDGPPKCPDCGQLCFGSISYQPKPTSRPATSTAPAAAKTAARQLPPAAAERGSGGQP